MAKTKTPFFSLGSRGTIADTLTSQKSGRDTIVRTKPIPADPYSLGQAYQRWLYRDYAYLWTLQTNSEKQVYRTNASRYHITGFSLWMREHLRDLPDILAWYKLDVNAGATTVDSSRNNNPGTIFGASPITGEIDGALWFDGINDEVNCGASPVLDVEETFTIEALVKPNDLAPATQHSIAQKVNVSPNSFMLTIWGLTPAFYVMNGAWTRATSPDNLSLDTRYHILGTYDANLATNNIKLYVDGQFKAQAHQPVKMNPTVGDLRIAEFNAGFNRAIIDNVILYNRVLDTTEILRHSQRRYPPQ